MKMCNAVTMKESTVILQCIKEKTNPTCYFCASRSNGLLELFWISIFNVSSEFS